uniref:Uncharacterized protein n=1 Tax=Manihot esculenta TaxID=3983 RepID=A0A2C9WEN0_MANES
MLLQSYPTNMSHFTHQCCSNLICDLPKHSIIPFPEVCSSTNKYSKAFSSKLSKSTYPVCGFTLYGKLSKKIKEADTFFTSGV